MVIRSLLLACSLLLAFPQAAYARVVISEVLWAGSVVSAADEWVEIVCKDAKESEESEELAEQCPADIGEWSLYSRNSAGTDILMFMFPEGMMIEEGEFLLVSNYAAGESVLSIEPDFVTTAVSLPNTGLRLTLKDADGNVIDIVDDGSGAPFAGRSAEPKASMERVDVFVSGESATNWKTAEVSLNFDAGVEVLGSPGEFEGSKSLAQDSSDSSVSSEAKESSVPSESSSASFASFESSESFASFSSFSSTISVTSITSQTSKTLSISLRISEVLPNPVGTDDREWIEIQNTGTVEANIAGWKLKRGTATYMFPDLTASGYLVEPGGFRIYYKFESGLSLPNDGGLVELFDVSGTLIDSFLYNGGGEGVSSGRDALGNRTAYCVPTPFAPNFVTAFDPKIEIQSGRSTDYDAVTLNLNTIANASLTDAKCMWDFGDGETSETCNPSSHTWSEYGVYRVKLTAVSACAEEAERELEVVVMKKKTQEKQETQETQRSSSSAASFNSLESFESFVFSLHSSSAPICVPSASTGLIISSVFSAPNKDEDEWIELRNVTSIPLDLCGWSIDDTEDAGSKPWKIAKSLIMEAGSTRKFLSSETKIALNNAGDDVRLLNALGEVVDMLTYKNAKKGTVIVSLSLLDTPAFSGLLGVTAAVVQGATPVISSSAPKAYVSRNEQKNYTTNVASGLIGSVVKSLNIRYEGRGFSSVSSEMTLQELPEEFREVFGNSELPISVDTPKSASPVLLTLIIIQSVILCGFAIWRIL